ncbi:MAG: hypothetical protein U1B83_07790 [Candidatus Cloacimonadaceae bacterium]|nr:hypothetical protein [Candidatus Cloacimonadaceae bacterium]
MKTMIKISMLMSLTVLFIAGCQTNPTVPEQSVFDTSVNYAYTVGGEISQQPILNDRMQNAGSIAVSNDARNIYITYTMDNGWLMTETDLRISKDVSGLPGVSLTLPVPLDFQYRTNHSPALKIFTYRIALDAHRLRADDDIRIMANATLIKSSGAGDLPERESLMNRDPRNPRVMWNAAAKYTIKASRNGGDSDLVTDLVIPGKPLEN